MAPPASLMKSLREGAPATAADAAPAHVAIILDGNGGWAKARGLPRGFGHKAGVDSL